MALLPHHKLRPQPLQLLSSGGTASLQHDQLCLLGQPPALHHPALLCRHIDLPLQVGYHRLQWACMWTDSERLQSGSSGVLTGMRRNTRHVRERYHLKV